MGLWERQVVPRMVERCCGHPELERLRAEACAGLAGTVVEIGFGSGRNAPHYPPAVTRVLAVEPSDVALRLGRDRVARRGVPVQRAGRDATRLPLPDGSVDAALSTWTLCTVPDPAAALAELRRVLAPGGRLHLVEHGLAPDPRVARWQRRLEPLQRRVAGGCHLTRDVPGLLAAAGLAPVRLRAEALPGVPRPFGWTTVAALAAPD